jgi:DNA adenine methylase
MSAALRPYPAGAAPFLKWAGGKGRLIAQYAAYLPPREEIGRYYEPFIGSAAVFFHLQPADACLADQNRHLVEAYQIVQQAVEPLIEALRLQQNDAEHYYRVRAQQPAELTAVERAARLIYLNKTGFNGLYRENRGGQFNVPFGRYRNPTICDPERLRACSTALQGVRLQVADFAATVAAAGPGDLVYFDPPYVPLSATSNFTAYNGHGFGPEDQRRLAQAFHDLTGRGTQALLSNSDTPLVRELYAGRGYRLVEIQARRTINSRADRRGPVTELLIANW